MSGDRTRYQIKSRRPTEKNKSRQLGFLRNLDKDPFDYLAACIFNEDHSIYRAALIPYYLLESRSKYSSHANAWLFHLKDEIWELEGVEDVTEKLKSVKI